jgi:hypothetical protein
MSTLTLEHKGNPVLREALVGGRYDAKKLAELLDWRLEDIARYLQKDVSTVSKYSASVKYQDALAQLAAITKEMLELLGGNVDELRAWMRTPIRAIEGSPKACILAGNLRRVDDLIHGYHSNLTF